MGEMLIKAEGLCKDYGKKSVLHDVDFTINKGDIYGLRWMTYKMTAVTEDTDLWN